MELTLQEKTDIIEAIKYSVKNLNRMEARYSKTLVKDQTSVIDKIIRLETLRNKITDQAIFNKWLLTVKTFPLFIYLW